MKASTPPQFSIDLTWNVGTSDFSTGQVATRIPLGEPEATEESPLGLRTEILHWNWLIKGRFLVQNPVRIELLA